MENEAGKTWNRVPDRRSLGEILWMTVLFWVAPLIFISTIYVFYNDSAWCYALFSAGVGTFGAVLGALLRRFRLRREK
ncbi:hypothetical protein [Arcanobacterium hippocoleae]|uniref:DUF2530 domain-containing protein n=1 Tax=Arcanobacterium hippocoleae TaxID=149017 RepID=A0ABU1T277_9ACTO|nr:hypothetical protein [Arcanobacterium hippocoleae]MDR6939471.1 hypothetical protein [Arcanobacterium hippocoleae]